MKDTSHLYAILREDTFSQKTEPKKWITLKEVVPDPEMAEAECARLNGLNGDKGIRYFVNVARIKNEHLRSCMEGEDVTIFEVIKAARTIQEFLWSGMNEDAGLEEFRRMFRKRLAKIEEIRLDNPFWRTELKKRLLQTAAIAVNLIHKLDSGQELGEGVHPTLPSNLSEYTEKVED